MSIPFQLLDVSLGTFLPIFHISSDSPLLTPHLPLSRIPVITLGPLGESRMSSMS